MKEELTPDQGISASAVKGITLKHMGRELDNKIAEIAALKAEVESLKGRLTSIGDLAHDTSTGPAAHDTYWEIRSMAYEAVQP